MKVNRYQLFVIRYQLNSLKDSFKSFEELDCWQASRARKGRSYLLLVIRQQFKHMSRDSFRSFEDLECWKACTEGREEVIRYSLLVEWCERQF